MADVAPRVTPLVVPGRGVDRHVPSYRGLRVTMGGFGFPLVALQGRVRARSVMVGVAVVAMLFPLVGVAPAAQAAAATTVVSLTFDDTNADQMGAATTMQASGLHGTFYAISGSIGTPNYLTLANLQTLYGAGNEIGGHTVNHPDLTLESADEAQRQICDARNQLTAWGFPQTSFAYPYEVVNASVETIVKNCGYNSARSLGDVQTQLGGTAGLYAETVPPPDAFALRAPDEVDSTWTLADLQNTVINAENNGGGWDILTFHRLCAPGTANSDPIVSISPELFTQFTTWLAAHIQAVPTTSVKTVGQVIGGTVKPAVTAPAPPEVAGALTNASLETAATAGVPKCWSAYGYGTNTPAFAETSPGHTGNVAETITMTGYTDGDAKLLPTFDTGGCSPGATAGHTYHLGAWYKSTGVTQFEVYYRTAAGAFVYLTSSPYFAAATAWTQAVWTTPALPADATGISFGLNILGNGSLTTDDYTYFDVTSSTPGGVVPVPPSRVMDTRSNLGVNGPVPSMGTASLQVTGKGGVPATGVSAVVVNITAVNATSSGFITVWPSGTAQQQTSNLNFQAGQNIPNLVVVPVGADGKIQLFNGSGGTVEQLDLSVRADRDHDQVRDVLPGLEVPVRRLLLRGARRPHRDEPRRGRVDRGDVHDHRGHPGRRDATLTGDLQRRRAHRRHRAVHPQVAAGVHHPGRRQRGHRTGRGRYTAQDVAGDVGQELHGSAGTVEQLDLSVRADRDHDQVRDVLPGLEVQVRRLLLRGARRPHRDEPRRGRVDRGDVHDHRGHPGRRDATLTGDLQRRRAHRRHRAVHPQVAAGVHDPGRRQRGHRTARGRYTAQDVAGDVGQELHGSAGTVEQLDLSVRADRDHDQVRDVLPGLEVQVRRLLLRGARWPHRDEPRRGRVDRGDVHDHRGHPGRRNATLTGDLQRRRAHRRHRAVHPQVAAGVHDPGRRPGCP